MTVKFDLFQGKATQDAEIVSLSAIRQAVKGRLDAAQRRLDPRNIFQQNARKNSNDDGFLGSMVINMLSGGAIAAGLDAAFDMPECVGEIEDGFLSLAFEAATTLDDARGDDTARRRNKIDLYPQGRRRDPLLALKPQRSFNMVSGNDNSRYENDAKAEAHDMAGMLKMIDDLECKNVRNLRLMPESVVYTALRAA